MGTYLNPGNSGFTGILNDQYIDKTSLIALMNETIYRQLQDSRPIFKRKDYARTEGILSRTGCQQ